MADKKFTLQFDFEGNIGPIKTAIENFKKSLNGIDIPDTIGKNLEKTFDKLGAEIENFQAIIKTGFSNSGDISKAGRSFSKIATLLSQLEIQTSSFTGIDPKKFLPQEAINKVKKLEEALSEVRKEMGKKTNLDKQIDKQTKEIQEQEKALKKLQQRYNEYSAKNKILGSQKGVKINEKKAAEKRREEIFSQMTTLEGEGKKDSAEYLKLNSDYKELTKTINNLNTDIRKLNTDINGNKVQMAGLSTQIDQGTKSYEQMKQELQNLKNIKITPQGLTALRTEIAKLTNTELDKIPTDLDELQKTIQGLTDKQLENIVIALAKIRAEANQLPPSANGARLALDDLFKEHEKATRAAEDIQHLKNQLLDFFSLTNSVELFKRAISSAFDTVKELDKVMTETAVVTDYSIEDMWDKLPQYAGQASKLGTSISDLYGATTLYYQQGLKTNEAMSVGIETMKMARIANMDATDATTAMTAALRGFNMAVNEMNAQKVNDVYSELAAITAADTNQIATAMSKTASIAASANMEFETTAAFLAQIIETTQEAPETAGTALKTIIARFTEVKELFNEGMLTGQDSEGEEININKIDEALRTVGISLKDFLNGTKGMDDIFLELASKWSDLDLATQRYIATTAAGSRQQSRFIAMMSNYGRTIELVNAANNSTNASQEQFNKTLESLDAKLQQLKNAWDTFAMGLANDQAIKGIVDVLTFLLNTLNKIIDIVSGENGVIKSMTSLALAFGAFKIGGSVFEAAFASIRQVATTAGKDTSINFSNAFQTSLKQKFGDFGGYFKKLILNNKTKNDFEKIFDKENKSFDLTKIDKLSEESKSKIAKSLLGEFDEAVKGLDKSQEEIDNAKKEFQSLFDSDQPQKAIARLNDELSGTGKKINEANIQSELTSQRMTANFGKAAAIVGSLAVILNVVTSQLQKAGHERGAEGFEALATGASVAAGILGTIPALIKMIGATAATAFGWVSIALTVIVSLGAAISKWVETDAEKLERLSKEAQEAADAAKEAKEAYDSLLSNKSEYSELQEELEGLIKGTDEWKQKLIEVNNEVLSLLDIYPELAKYIGRGKEGQLVIQEGGWEEIIENQQSQMKTSQYLSMANKGALLDEEIFQSRKKTADIVGETALGVNRKRLSDSLGTVNKTIDVGDFRELAESEDVRDQELAELYFNFSDLLEDGNTYQRLKANGNLDSVLDGLDGQDTFVTKIPKTIEKEVIRQQNEIDSKKLQKASLYSTLLDTNNIDFSNSEKEIRNLIAHGYSQNMGQNLDSQIKETKKYYSSPYHRQELAVDYEEIFGRGSSAGLSESVMIQQIGKQKATDQDVNNFEKIITALENVNEEENRSKYATWLSLDSGKITSSVGAVDKEQVQAMLTAMGITDKSDIAAFAQNFGATEDGGDWEEQLAAIFNQAINDGKQEISNKIKEAINLGITSSNFRNGDEAVGILANATAEQIGAYTNFAAQIFGALGSSNGESFMAIFDDMLEDEEKRQKILDYLSDADFTQEDAGEDFVEFLKEIGAASLVGEDKLEDFAESLKQLSKGFELIDLSKVINNVKELLDLSDDLSERKESQGFTQEEYDKIITSGIVNKEDFFWNGQEWTYIGGAMEDLALAIREKTDTILQEDRETIQKQIDLGKQAEGIANDEQGIKSLSEVGISKEDFLTGKVTDFENLQEVIGGTTLAETKWLYDQMIHAWNQFTPNQEKIKEYNEKADQTSSYMKETTLLGTLNPEEAIPALKAQADAYDISTETILAYEKALNAAGKKEEEASKRALELAIKNAQIQQSIDKAADSLKNYAETMKMAEKGSIEYDAAVANAVNELNKIFGTEFDWKEAGEGFDELLSSWLDGSEEAFIQIRQMLSQSLEYNLDRGIRGFDRLDAEIAKLDFSATGEVQLNNSDLLKSIEVSEQYLSNFIAYLRSAHGLEVTMNMNKKGNGYVIDTLSKMEDFVPTGSRKSGGGGGSSKWENPYDKLYNTVQRINAELRLRERLEREYQRLLNNSVVSSAELAKNSREQIASLEYEKKTREYLLEKRREEMALLGSEFSDVAHYASWDENIGIMLNQEALAKLDGSTNQELTSKVEKYISKMEEKADQIYEEADAIDEIEDTVKEIREQGKDEYIDFENQVKDALIFEREQEIEKLTEINEAINDSNSKLISAMQESINKERQARENSKTEEELAEKRQRLAQLQMDTSGTNTLEILALEEEIAEQEQGYIDTLVDQKIQALQDQNDKAYEQRQHQIEILQWQREFWEENGDIWEDVQQVVREGFSPETGIINGSKLEEILQNEANFEGLSAIGQQEWWKDLTETLTAAFGYLEVNQQLEDIGATAGEKIKFKYGSKELSGIVNEDGSVTTDDGRIFNNVYKGFGGYYAGENINETQKNVVDEPIYESSKNKENNTGYDNDGRSREEIKGVQKKLKALGYDVGEIDGLYGSKTRSAVIGFKISRQMPEITDKITDYFLEKLSYSYQLLSVPKRQGGGGLPKSVVVQQAFATGGLADFTGPAWLDGTKAKPEYVLSAAQTERFFTLVDILDSWKDLNKDKNIQNNGDNIVDIDINIETVKEEADVDMLAEKVQHAIVTSARYRNNSFIQR